MTNREITAQKCPHAKSANRNIVCDCKNDCRWLKSPQGQRKGGKRK